MGVWDCFEYSVSVSGVIDARCETVWRLVADLDHYASISSNIASSTRILADGSPHNSHDPIAVGTRFRRTLRVGGKGAVLVSEFTMTEYDDLNCTDAHSFPKTVSIFTDSPTERMPRRVSWTVSRAPDDDESKCVLLLSATMLPKRLWLWFGGLKLVCVCRFRVISERLLERELQDFAAAATTLERKEESSKEQDRD